MTCKFYFFIFFVKIFQFSLIDCTLYDYMLYYRNILYSLIFGNSMFRMVSYYQLS